MSVAGTGLSVIVPCFNEADGLEQAYREVTDALADVADLEILLIDDGSTDDTLARMRALAASDRRVHYVSFTRNYGLAAATTAGFSYASRPWIAQVDADLQNPPSEIWKLLAKAAEGYDVVFGVRTDRQDRLLRRWGSSAQQWFARRVLGIEVPPGASSFRVLRAGVARTLADLRLGGPYFIAMVPMLGARYACVPTDHRPRPDRSRFRAAQLVGHTFELFFGYSWRPLNASYLIAVAGATLAVGLSALTAAGVLGLAAATAGLLAVSAAVLAALGLVSRYLHRMMLDQKPTRTFYVREANIPVRSRDRVDGGEPEVPPPARLRGPEAEVSPPSRPAGSGESACARPAGSGRASLLVLGAGEEQVPLFLEARRRGLRTIAVDRLTHRPGLRHADQHLHLSTRHPQPIADAVGDHPIAGVVTAASDAGLLSWAELSDRYRTPYRYPRAAALASMDKASFHRIAAAAGVRSYRWYTHRDPAALTDMAGEIGYPVVVKPVDGSGSRGVTLVATPHELPAAVVRAAQFTVSGDLLLEEYLAGDNLTVDVFLRDRAVAFLGITQKRILPGPHFVVGGHTCPAPAVGAELRAELAQTTLALCRAAGLVDGPANLDIIIDAAGHVRVLEANLRLCGNSVPRLMREVYGVDTVAALVALAVGEPFDLTVRRHGTGIVHLVGSPLDVDGVLTEVAGLDEVRAMPGVAECEIYAEPGTVVRPFTEGGHKFGFLLVSGANLDEAESTLATALARLQITVVPVAGPPATRQRQLVEGVRNVIA